MTDDVLMFLLGDFVSQFAKTISDELTILQVNCTQEKPCALRKMFCKLDVRRKSIVTLTLSYDNRKIIVRYFVYQAPDVLRFTTLSGMFAIWR